MPAFFLSKQPWEEFRITVDFAVDRLVSSEIITVHTVTAAKMFDGSDATADVLGTDTESGEIITIPVKAGVDGERYNIVIRVTTDMGNKYEVDVVMVIGDRP